MMDRFNVWVGSLYTRSLDIKKDEGQTFVEFAPHPHPRRGRRGGARRVDWPRQRDWYRDG